jgi:hypothetical protein
MNRHFIYTGPICVNAVKDRLQDKYPSAFAGTEHVIISSTTDSPDELRAVLASLELAFLSHDIRTIQLKARP